jgi:hypothetical protein
MNLNPLNPNSVEKRREKRKALEADHLDTIGRYLRDELSNIAGPEWSQEMIDELIEAKVAETQHIIDALTTAELENDFAMQRHAEKAVAEIRSEVYRRMGESRTKS